MVRFGELLSLQIAMQVKDGMWPMEGNHGPTDESGEWSGGHCLRAKRGWTAETRMDKSGCDPKTIAAESSE